MPLLPRGRDNIGIGQRMRQRIGALAPVVDDDDAAIGFHGGKLGFALVEDWRLIQRDDAK